MGHFIYTVPATTAIPFGLSAVDIVAVLLWLQPPKLAQIQSYYVLMLTRYAESTQSVFSFCGCCDKYAHRMESTLLLLWMRRVCLVDGSSKDEGWRCDGYPPRNIMWFSGGTWCCSSAIISVYMTGLVNEQAIGKHVRCPDLLILTLWKSPQYVLMGFLGGWGCTDYPIFTPRTWIIIGGT